MSGNGAGHIALGLRRSVIAARQPLLPLDQWFGCGNGIAVPTFAAITDPVMVLTKDLKCFIVGLPHLPALPNDSQKPRAWFPQR
ncbi:MAG: hypothetical protein COA47_00130 [Robiginitomaculum sp.]|nr:MAG: hypothetical protein COA47_00130 [Robiginitomaculum sp.]